MNPQDEQRVNQRAASRALLEGRTRCCHGQGLAAFESILECGCGKAWHTGCITKFLVNRSYPKERVLMDNDGVLHKTSLEYPYACCRSSLGKYGTQRA